MKRIKSKIYPLKYTTFKTFWTWKTKSLWCNLQWPRLKTKTQLLLVIRKTLFWEKLKKIQLSGLWKKPTYFTELLKFLDCSFNSSKMFFPEKKANNCWGSITKNSSKTNKESNNHSRFMKTIWKKKDLWTKIIWGNICNMLIPKGFKEILLLI